MNLNSPKVKFCKTKYEPRLNALFINLLCYVVLCIIVVAFFVIRCVVLFYFVSVNISLTHVILSLAPVAYLSSRWLLSQLYLRRSSDKGLRFMTTTDEV